MSSSPPRWRRRSRIASRTPGATRPRHAYKYLARPYALKPNLAVYFPEVSADGLTYTIRLKPGVFFVDDPAFPQGKGREVVAQDVVYSLQRHFDPKTRPQGAWLWQGRIVALDEWKEAGSDYSREIPGLRALDRHTLQIRLTRPYPQLADTLAQGYSAIVPREAAEFYGKELAIRPVGSGPFRVVAYDTSRVVMERNPYFWQVDQEGNQLPYIDRVTFGISQDVESLNNIAGTF